MPNLVPVPLSLWAGIYNVLFAFRTGAPVLVMDRFDPVEFADLVARFAIRSSVLPPAGVDLRVLDEAGEPAGAGAPGELWVRTPAMSAGYADGRDLSRPSTPRRPTARN